MFTTWSDTLDNLLALQRALESSRSSDWFGGTTASQGAYPLVNVFQQGDDFVLIAELPGINKQDLNIEIKRNQLRLAGTKQVGNGEGKSVHRRERLSGKFDRVITFPAAIETEGAKAEYQDGILALFLPRAASERPKAIEVQ
ncbi:MAG: Hsp20/alpha crystallin family protein [Gammaproteobacteria bacterium]|jgi:HSP20 family protein